MKMMVDLSGFLQTLMTSLGFIMIHSLSELIDNVLDARDEVTGKATIVFALDSKEETIKVRDPESGMDKKITEESVHMLKRKEENGNTKQGKYHLGLTAAILYFNQAKKATTTLTKQICGELFKMEVDWPACLKTDGIETHAAEANSKWEKYWEENAIDSAHGTEFIIPAVDEKFNELVKGIRSGDLLEKLGKKYAIKIAQGLSIVFDLDGEQFVVTAEDVLGYAEAPEHLKQSVLLETYINPHNKEHTTYITAGCKLNTRKPAKPTKMKIDELRTELETRGMDANGIKKQLEAQLYAVLLEEHNASHLPMYCDLSGSKPELIKAEIPEDFELVGKLMLKTVAQIGCKHANPGIHRARNDILVGDPYIQPKAAGGDMAEQLARHFTRSVAHYTPDMDDLIGTQANKSLQIYSDINENLRETITAIHNAFWKKVYDEYDQYPKLKKAKEDAKKKAKEDAKKKADEEGGPSEDDDSEIAEQEEKKKVLEKLSKINDEELFKKINTYLQSLL
jgi:hypothetical protein